MKPNERFQRQPKHFWANVRTVSQGLGYTQRKTRQIKVFTLAEVKRCLENKLGLTSTHILDAAGNPTELGATLQEYFVYRADVLNNFVRTKLMNVEQATALFQELRNKLNPKCPLPLNKQKGEKRTTAFFTSIINMLIEANAEGLPCNYDPKVLTTFTQSDAPLRTLARRIDGAFPAVVNPIAVWEIKEYYFTKTFGSRVADGVYETLLDGMELEELKEHENIEVKHYLMVDDYFTWWDCGRSYLCRIVDMLHMGYVDEVLFGNEVLDELPRMVREWVEAIR
jgi:hypothetical protein